MVNFSNDVLVAVDAIRGALLADVTFAAGVNDQVYYRRVRKGATFPYAFVGLNAGAEDNSSAVNMSDLRFLVKVVGDTDYASLAILAGRIYGLLHEVDLSDVSEGWWIWRSQRITVVDFTEIEAEVDYSHVGGIYRLRLSS